MFCDSCAAEPATIDHLDLSGGESVLKRLCRRCADLERAQWNAERRRRPALLEPRKTLVQPGIKAA
jgi:protein-arginine kinase activator protein McsA